MSAFSVGYRVDVEKWSPETQRCNQSTTHGVKKIQASVINKEIERFSNCCNSIFEDFERRREIPSRSEFVTLFNRALGNNAIGKATAKVELPDDDFYDIFDSFIATMSVQNSWTTATIRKFAALKSNLIAFSPTLSLSTFDEDKMQEFANYMHRVPYRNTTIAKHLKLVKWFLRWAFRNNYYNGKVHESYQAKLKGSDGKLKKIIYLEWAELMTLMDYSPLKPHLERVRDVFCFCCFTGLRYSDVKNLTRSDVFSDHISVITQKTTDSLQINLNKYSQAILDKYKDVPFPDDLALPVISNVKMNVALKTLGELVGLKEKVRLVYFKGNKRIEEVKPKYELLTTHAGRRSFVVNGLFLGIPVEVIMKWTGHSDFKSMVPYMEIVDKLKAKEMEKFNV